ncbi:MAG: lipopolysaccharide heptosyltransferase I [Thermodesulfobacteriota bacterium]|nr:lipopolysaccharide heptosyltransferase I [Thermodesulfobacteriota bacterium]
MNILIIKLSSIGDVIHTLPSLASLRKRFADAHISWVVEEGISNIIENHPYLNEVIVFKKGLFKKTISNPLKYPYLIAEVAQFVRKLGERQYDIVIDYQGLLKSGIISFLSRGKRRIGFDKTRELSYLFLNERVPQCAPNIHATEKYRKLTMHITEEQDSTEFLISIKESDTAHIVEMLSEGNTSTYEPYVVMNPGTKWKSKMWPDDKYVSLAHMIKHQLHYNIVFSGGMSDRETIENITQRLDFPIKNIAGKTTLRQAASLFKMAKAAITPDTGPMHIAAAVGTPVVALFGPTSPSRTGPHGKKHVIIGGKSPCSPCFNRDCTDMTCMENITVDEVFHALVTCCTRTDD